MRRSECKCIEKMEKTINNEDKAKLFLENFYKSRPVFFLEKLNDNTKGIFVILRLLAYSTEEIFAGDISSKLSFSTPRVAAALNTLEKKRYISRKTSTSDARKTIVNITDEGMAALKEREAELLKFVTLLIDKVGEQDLNEFLRIAVEIQNAVVCR